MLQLSCGIFSTRFLLGGKEKSKDWDFHIGYICTACHSWFSSVDISCLAQLPAPRHFTQQGMGGGVRLGLSSSLMNQQIMACGGPGETWHKLPCPLTGISGNYCSPWQINGIAAQHIEATLCHTLAWYQHSWGPREVASNRLEFPPPSPSTHLGGASIWHKFQKGNWFVHQFS